MADSVLRPVERGLGPSLQHLTGNQRVGDGQTDPGAGTQAAKAMTGMPDASTAGGYKQDSAGRYAHIPEPMRGLIGKTLAKDPDPQSR